VSRSKLFSKSLLRSERFRGLPDDGTRLFYMMIQLDMDNIGRTQAGIYYLLGKLYPGRKDITPEKIGEMRDACRDIFLLLVYKSSGIAYTQDPFHLNHNKIVGNMSTESEYPAPSEQLITQWEQETNSVYTLSNLV